MRAHRTQNDERIFPAAAEASFALGQHDVGQARIVPLLAGGFFVRGEVRKDFFGGVGQQGAQLVHLSPNSRAMMPRKISRVPPRSEKDGDD